MFIGARLTNLNKRGGIGSKVKEVLSFGSGGMRFNDAYPKMIIARTKHDAYDYQGIQVVDIARWLKGE